VDVGGTFTDIVVFDERRGEVVVSKVRSSHPTPDVAVLEGVRALDGGRTIEELEYFVHGTTVGLNAVLEGRGPRLAMLATRGFRDVLEIRRGNQTEDPYNLFWTPPPPLIRRALRFGISERISSSGEIVKPISDADVEAALLGALARGAEGIVVAFLNAYANPVHEREAEAKLRALGYEGEITLSHRVSREYREYERTSTAVVNGYIRPHVSSYLGRLGEGLARHGFAGTSLVTRSGGGALTFAQGQDRPFETLLSGPVAGVEGAAYLGRRLGHERIITADVGGTSFDTALILDGRPHVKHEGRIAGLPVQTPWVDVRSIGAGGGSIAQVDAGGLLRVGPRSAGSSPGPAAYGLGGTEPTVTDAAVALGMFPVNDLSGAVRLDTGLAEAALRPLAERLGITLEGVARGILAIAASKMADAIREITVESGEDPRTAALVAFGGAGPLFATQLAHELDVEEIVVPPHAGVFSAWGLLVTDAVRVGARTRLLPLEEDSLPAIGELLAELYQEIGDDERDTVSEHAATHAATLDLRYVGQEHHLSVPVEVRDDRLAAGAETIAADFSRLYARSFGITLNAGVEIVGVRAEIRRPLHAPERELVAVAPRPDDRETPRSVARAYSLTADRWCDFAVVQRTALPAGEVLRGPAVVVEDTTTTYVDQGYAARIGDTGCVHLTRDSEED
jgi:N-methylhydantoinase A